MFKKLLTLIVIACCLSCKANDMETVRVVLPYGPGGGPDKVFRILQAYGLKRNINFVPEYKPGAQGLIGMQYALTQKDTLMVCIVSDVVKFHNKNKLNLDYFKTVGALSKVEVQVAVRSNLPVTSLKDLLEQIKREPQKYTWAVASSSMADNIHWLGRQLSLSKDDLFIINFQTLPQSVMAVASGTVDIVTGPTTALEQLYQTNKLRRLGVLKGFPTEPEETSLEKIFKTNAPLDGIGVFMNTEDPRLSTKWIRFMQEFITDQESVKKFKEEHFPVFEDINRDLDKVIKYHLVKLTAPQDLTFRQEQIARLIKSRGLTVKQLAETLNISEATVKLHTGLIMKKFGVQNRTQLVVAMNNFG